MTGLGLVPLVVWAQVWSSVASGPGLPPARLIQLEGHFALEVEAGGIYEDSVGDFQAWVQRIPWAEGQEWYPASCVELSEPLYLEGRPVQQLYLHSWQLHRSGSRLRRWKGLPPYRLRPSSVPPRRQGRFQFASHSVLAQGQWYKIATGRPGIYRITYQTLQALGLNPATIDPRTFQVYGQRGGPLPQENEALPPDDLVEIPLYFPGASDGRWDPEDAAYFWAASPDAWYPLAQSTRPYFHLKNPYTDSCAYFITWGRGMGQRIASTSPPPTPLVPRSQGLLLFFHEQEQTNILKSGRVWLGEKMTQFSPSLALQLPLPACDSLKLYVQLAGTSLRPAQIALSWDGTSLATLSVPALSGIFDDRQAVWVTTAHSLSATRANPTLSFRYIGSEAAYLDFVEVVGWFPLAWSGGQTTFYLPAGANWEVRLQAPEAPIVWDVTDDLAPQQVSGTFGGGLFTFGARGDTLRRYQVFSLNAVYDPTPIGQVRNQDLHALHRIRWVIATTEAQAALAQQFCQLHPESGPCAVVTLDQLYNEFSGGRPDICALRNFLRMLYKRATDPSERPAFLLIVGAASYDFRARGPTLFPTYQSRESFYPPGTYGSDDFFGFLDEAEGFWGEGFMASYYDPRDQILQRHLLDIGICRLPTYSLEDLSHYLEKLREYLTNPSARGSWLQKVIFFSDYKDNGLHTQQAEELATELGDSLPYLDQAKIYLDRYPAVPRASGLVFPQAQQALLSQLNQGALIAHYVGHGNEYTLQSFEFFPLSVVRQLQNVGRYVFFVTATCDWGKWDVPEIRSGGVEVLFLPKRGAIGLLTSTRKVFASLNFALSKNFYAVMAEEAKAGGAILLGRLMQQTKNRSWGGAMAINTRSFAFLGDPLLPLGLPRYKVVLTRVGARAPSATDPDTLRPLRPVHLEGEVQRPDGSPLPNFTGTLYMRLWDKAVTRQTLISRTSYTAQEILLFNGEASVRAGRFSLTVRLPLEILPQVGHGRISAWAQDEQGNAAAGAETRFILCCPDTTLQASSPPQIRLYIGDTTWVAGGWTDPNPLLLAYITDSLGINLSPLAVGKEIKAFLNQQEYFLGAYYQARRDRPNEGRLEYRFTNLPEGEYRLRLRVYNLAGQEGTAETYFTVVERRRLRLGRVFNYPNPFTTATRFCFEHNQPGEPLEARVWIYTLSGRLVQTLSTLINSRSTFCQELFWDGLDSYGDRLARGVYIYRLEVRNLATGEKVSAQEKLVLLR
ncbi:MAG: type IX secretion system sortase PorU [Bacteroidia bacterium]|nr:type IX secretion system sortase PorU [Bacteroidia bacterium]MDW8088643.1 type IX secretion system sortase PorU [Bacteroidia bacterium]